MRTPLEHETLCCSNSSSRDFRQKDFQLVTVSLGKGALKYDNLKFDIIRYDNTESLLGVELMVDPKTVPDYHTSKEGEESEKLGGNHKKTISCFS